VIPEILRLSLGDAARGIVAREFSALELTRAYLARIESVQPRVNCFISVEADAATDRARQLDRELAGGKYRGPLHGVPIAFKDMFFRAGKVTTFGSRIAREFVADTTATVIEKLERAGAVLLGGLNMGEFAISPSGHNEHFADCRNPWNTVHAPGGSSSGSGAAVAARALPAAIGSDTGGSVRLPAAMCGVVGLKPTYGMVSRHGAMHRSWSLDTIGPLARTAADCAIVMQAIAGIDERDFTTRVPRRVDFIDAIGHTSRAVRVGLPQQALLGDVTPEVSARLQEAVQGMRAAGLQVNEVSIPDFRAYYHAANVINKVELSSAHGKWIRTRREDYGRAALARIEGGFHVPATHYLEALRARARLLEDFVQRAFASVDALFLPVLGVPVPTLAETDFQGAQELPGLLELLTRYTRWVNYLGLPAVSVPCGFTANGLPVGFQLVGRPSSDHRLLAAAHRYQTVTSWHTQAPELN
jgi:aspartyl-tRNA(Asn)/glutamyl-tRNA(Gln) amidotransferase subunit A